MNTFREYHPGVTVLYFLAVITVNIVVFGPVLFGISFVSQSVFYLYLKGTRAGILFAGKCLAFVVMCTVVNAFVNHRGGSVLFFAGGLPVTLECIFYGIITGFLLSDSILSFSCYHSIMTSEKVMCLTGNFFPSFSLVLSMALGLVPKLKRDYGKLRENHKLVKNYKVQTGILSALIGFSLEDSLEMGVSMRYRGFGRGKRTSVYGRRFQVRDGILLSVIFLCAASGMAVYVRSGTGLEVFPFIEYYYNGAGLAAYMIFTVLYNIPMAMNVKEELKWKRIVSKI